ncbi:immediate early protein 1 [Erinnyis ello granulovirus]|uniref:Immediate early protein 1 n=1 Tax=Erinnyis ello granulovirus TaxID=307444 RepID=A0A097DAJ8_9BBAC|nr:immediate early protein 1 [Erinnyis ello granulovirus]AIS92008.1 immediate early protein 1 [Erinnyis ello granulovirus]ARX71347.1 immediate early protein 1 [Erinnyis ello granulovirus]ARX71477.1 immediate early protein 1 [Erinnyis ello granulovirus]ARX71607.1 immediate early protein 1 [Erinnyis ello granulovirus]ARX71737.1 immediate early protein 1 [Erinnyis ello granulovirus]
MEEEERDECMMITNDDSEYESEEEMETQAMDLSDTKNVAVFNETAKLNVDDIAPPLNANPLEISHYKWLNRFKTTTYHMFLCTYDGLHYVRNERYPEEVYMKHYHIVNGNAYEMLLRDCKFYLTTKMLQCAKQQTSMYPTQSVVKHVDLKIVAPLLQITLRDGNTLHQHIMEAVINTFFIGAALEDIRIVKQRLTSPASDSRIAYVSKKYSWKSEDRKIKELCVRNENEQIKSLFDILYRNNKCHKFTTDASINYTNFITEFNYNVQQLKKPVTEHIDNVSQIKMMIKSLAILLYKTDTNELQDLKDVKGDEKDIDEFLRVSLQYPFGDVIFNMKTKDTNSQRYRLNCFKMDRVYVWVNSMVYKTSRFDLESVIEKYAQGTHYVLSFHYVFNSMLSKLHSEVVKLVLRYILSRRNFCLLQNDIHVNPKITYKCLMYSS